MKKIKKSLALLVIGAIISVPMRASFAHSEDSGGGDNQEIKNKDSNEHEQKNNDREDSEDEDSESNDEHDIFSLIVADSQKTPALTLPEIDEKSIQTYADVLNIIKSYENAVLQISVSAGVDTQTANLTDNEKALLNRLLDKHHKQFNHLNDRIAEVSAQLKQLEDLLSPLGTQPISPLYGIKGLLISELKNYKDIISGISEFDDLNLQILQEETD